MADIRPLDDTPETRALGSVISQSEGGGYNVLYGGGTFDNNGPHPPDLAAGQYQIRPNTWNDGITALNLPDKMTNENQDKVYRWLLARRGVTQDQLSNPDQFPQVINQLTPEWVSLPGGSQPRKGSSVESVRNAYHTALTPSDDELINSHQNLFGTTPSTSTPLTQDAPVSDNDLFNNHRTLFSSVSGNQNTPGTVNGKPASINPDGTFSYNNEAPPTGSDAYTTPQTTLLPGQTSTPQPTFGEKVAQAPGAIANSFVEGYNNTPSIINGMPDYDNKTIGGGIVAGINGGIGAINGATRAIGQELPYQVGNAISGPGLGRGLAGLTTSALLATGGSPKWQAPDMVKLGTEAQTPFPDVIPAKVSSKTVPNQPLTPAMQPGATSTMIEQEGALRAKFPNQFKAIDDQVDTTNLNHLQNALNGQTIKPGYSAAPGKPILNQAVMDKLFNTDPKSPDFGQSLMNSDGKSIDPVKYNAWLDNISDPLNPPKFGGTKGPPNFQPHVLDTLEDIRNSVNRMAQVDEATNTAKGNGSSALNNLGTTMTQRLAATPGGGLNPISRGNLGPEIGGALAEYLLTKGISGIGMVSPIGPAAGYGLNMGRNLIASKVGPRVAAANQSAIADLLSKSTESLPPKYQPGKILPTP